MTTTYTVIGGVIVHEVRAGVQRNYRPDTLGSTVALTDGNTATDTWTYWPYGEVRTHSGSNQTSFTFVGTLGYCKVSGSDMTYVRARMYMASRARWATVDPLWPLLAMYSYSDNAPCQVIDPLGLQGGKGFVGPPAPGSPPGPCCDAIDWGAPACSCLPSCAESRDCCKDYARDFLTFVGFFCGGTFAAALAGCISACVGGYGIGCVLCLLAAGISLGCILIAYSNYQNWFSHCFEAYKQCLGIVPIPPKPPPMPPGPPPGSGIGPRNPPFG
ncbi:MAG: hypothetical protein JSS66_08540 [Armatimonadetes bacterium]|nr:hypothetical protein [Armatimonadota bacterium]